MTLNATPGDPDANSYLTVDAADEIATERGLGPNATGWLAATDAAKEKALIRATGEIDAELGAAGIPSNTDQALLFPRYVDQSAGVPYIIPSVELATYEQAAYVLANAEVIDNAAARRARGLISFSDDDGSGSVVAARSDFGVLAPNAILHIKKIRGLGRATLRSVPIASSYVKRGDLVDLQ